MEEIRDYPAPGWARIVAAIIQHVTETPSSEVTPERVAAARKRGYEGPLTRADLQRMTEAGGPSDG